MHRNASPRPRTKSVMILITFIAFLAMVPSFAYANQKTQNSLAKNPGDTYNTIPNVIKSDDFGITFEINTSPFVVTGNGTINVEKLEGRIVESGSPSLPYYSTFIALPPDADIEINVEESQQIIQRNLDIQPAPQERLWGEPSTENNLMAYSSGSIRELPPEFKENSTIYNQDTQFPGSFFSISDPMYMRDLRVVELRFFPLQYNPVQKHLTQALNLLVDVHFSGSNTTNLKPVNSSNYGTEAVWQELILNYEQSRNWRSLPQEESETNAVNLPIGAETFKIEVDNDGIYEITGSDLAAKGMSLPVDASTIQMMQNGKTVAYQLIDGNSNGKLNNADKIRFYGWAYDGSPSDKNYVTNNVFWLWADGSASNIPQINNPAGGTTVTSFRESITEKQELHYASAWSVEWDVNEPTSWHTRRFTMNKGTTKTENFDIELPNPTGTGNVAYLVELTTNLRRPASGSSAITFDAKTYLNNAVQFGQRAWTGPKNLNVVKSIAGSALKQSGDAGYPTNRVQLKISSNSPTQLQMHVTRITIDYTRYLIAEDDELIFGRETAGNSKFKISGFSNADHSKTLVWDISDQHSPKQIKMQAANITGSGSNHTYSVGRNHDTNARFIATTVNNVQKVNTIKKYVPISIDPSSGGAEWLAITHSTLRPAAKELADYRSQQMGTYLVSIHNIVNQIGYGFNTPETIRKYLRHAISDWSTAPDYVTLFGDATNNPRNLDCVDCGANWHEDTPTLIVTDFKFIDRWQGMVPSDFALSLLFGNDLMPDIAIARMPAFTLDEASEMARKVILYETQRKNSPEDWQKNFLFVADNPDSGGNFCFENANTGALLPDEYNQTHLCLQTPTVENINKLKADMGTQINDVGTSVVNYRGHGSTVTWAGYNGEPPILNAGDADFWQNSGRAAVVLSADCLDGYFILNYRDALGEAFLRLDNRGSVAHWSSAGLGYSSEHSILHSGFYEGVFSKGQNAIGDAVNFSKVKYIQSDRHSSELYSFTLLGDAALTVVPNGQSELFLPIIQYVK